MVCVVSCVLWGREGWTITLMKRDENERKHNHIRITHLQVSVHDAHFVQVVDGIQHLSDQRAGVLLCVEALLHDAVKQLAARDPAHRERECVCVSVCRRQL